MGPQAVARPGPAPDLGWGSIGLWMLAIFVLCVGAIRATPAATQIATWWPAAGVSVAVLMLTRPVRWQVLVPALAVVTALGNLAGGRPIVVATLFGAANATEAVVIAALLTGGGRSPARLTALADVRRLVLAIAAGAGVFGILAGAVVWIVDGGSFWGALRSGSVSHAASDLVVIALIMLVVDWYRDEGSERTWAVPGVGRPEIVAQLLATAFVLLVVFVPESTWPTASLAYSVFVWAGLRLTCAAAMLEVLVATVVAATFSAYGRGPFGGLAGGPSSVAGVGALLEAFIAILALVTLTLGISARQRRAALDAMTQERDFSTSLVDSTRAFLLVLDGDLRVVSVNGAARRASGRPLTELLGRRPWETVLSPADEGRVRDLVALSAREQVELPWRAGPSARRTVAWTAAGLTGAGRAVVMTGIDVTGHRDSERLLRTVLDAMSGTAILGLSRTGRIVFANAGAQSMLGYPVAELVGGMRLTDLHDVEELHRRGAELGSAPGIETIVASSELAPGAERPEWTWSRRDGTTLPVLLALDRVGEEGVLVAYVCFAEDAGERRRAERALHDALAHEREAVEHLHEVDRLKSTFVAAASHELRTPLTSMLGFIHVLGSPRGDPLTPRQRHLLSRLDRNGRRLLAMVEDLLVLSRVEARPMLLEGAALDLRDVIDGALQLVGETLEGRDLRLVVRDHGPCLTWGESAQLERAVVNLVSNSVKFTPDGGEVEVECLAEDGTRLLRVADTGVGIPEAEVEHVFEAFYRTTEASLAQVPGTGLGLAIVARIVEAHGGTVTCRSAPGVGTVMEVRLPAAGDRRRDE